MYLNQGSIEMKNNPVYYCIIGFRWIITGIHCDLGVNTADNLKWGVGLIIIIIISIG